MKKGWRITIVFTIILAVLAVSYFWGGGYAKPARDAYVSSSADAALLAAVTNAPDLNVQPTMTPSGTDPLADEPAGPSKSADVPGENSQLPEPAVSSEPLPQPTMEINLENGKDQYLTDTVPPGMPLPVEPQDVTISDVPHTCTISVSCATILNNMNCLDPEKVELVPENGWILSATTVTFYEGESLLNVLQRVLNQQDIHMEFVNTPIYNSAYIEGINNIYEFDCGELSGWKYKVNGWFSNYGCSRYQVQADDVIEWVYTCDLGQDLSTITK